ncbi:type IV pilin protein [Geobacter sp. AOG1]|uniref:type IV pilin protein n=1 Tax=Geobacter sp. AOG1 TaxID=1566346 RepID=UPI001DF2ED7A|nr:prepilin-type N-terminal cleavage/methylation domain-containing protein [Geobacter sp. AOG1]GFE58462.1 pilus assembly protein [Geobacter sp. AOG1]
MLNKLRSTQGFTLIELLIVVAIIGILAAIAIPQFSAYRMKGYNAAANSDLKNSKTGMEAYMSDRQAYPVALDAR